MSWRAEGARSSSWYEPQRHHLHPVVFDRQSMPGVQDAQTFLVFEDVDTPQGGELAQLPRNDRFRRITRRLHWRNIGTFTIHPMVTKQHKAFCEECQLTTNHITTFSKRTSAPNSDSSLEAAVHCMEHSDIGD